MKKIVLAVFLLLTIMLCGCSRFHEMTGVWMCEELGVTLDFGSEYIATAEGEIVIDGVVYPVVCDINPMGGAHIRYSDETMECEDGKDYIYRGNFTIKTLLYEIEHKEMKYSLYDENYRAIKGEVYIFAKVE